MLDEDNMTNSESGLSSEDADFEIKLLRGILKRAPNFFEALVLLGDLYTKVGRYEEGLAVDLRLQRLRSEDPFVLYNLACSYSLLNQIQKSLVVIQQAILCGYDDFKHLEKDPDLANLRQDSRFKAYYESLKKNLNHE